MRCGCAYYDSPFFHTPPHARKPLGNPFAHAGSLSAPLSSRYYPASVAWGDPLYMEPSITHELSGWGRHPRRRCVEYRPEKLKSLRRILCEGPQHTYIARGLGRSYGDAAVNESNGVVNCTRLDRMLSFNPATGLLVCEAGVSMEDIINVFLPRGYFPAVTPGTKYVTVGGAIANDVHGKNHHQVGSFANFVRRMTLLTPEGEEVACSREENSDVFWATIGGVGLTGIILTAAIELRRVESAYIMVDYLRSPDIDATLAHFEESDADYEYSVAWIDCLTPPPHLGRSVLMRGRHATAEESGEAEPLAAPKRRQAVLPFELPGRSLNSLTVRAFNTAFYHMHEDAAGQLVDYDRYFYPLDVVHHWDRMYGRPGFTQYQATLPPQNVEGVVELLQRLQRSQRASFLAVLKRFGDFNGGMLSHPMAGYTLTLDLPIRDGLEAFLHELDELVLQNEGRLYLAKDVFTRPEAFRAMYPRLDEFRAVNERLDPRRRLSSSMARRLEIVKS
jgi:FAD/FMN-containing dehydrogenase